MKCSYVTVDTLQLIYISYFPFGLTRGQWKKNIFDEHRTTKNEFDKKKENRSLLLRIFDKTYRVIFYAYRFPTSIKNCEISMFVNMNENKY